MKEIDEELRKEIVKKREERKNDIPIRRQKKNKNQKNKIQRRFH
jgi:hypothetical protein